jgi:redox-sensitive bicupin YhaK (pirin superfamily)
VQCHKWTRGSSRRCCKRRDRRACLRRDDEPGPRSPWGTEGRARSARPQTRTPITFADVARGPQAQAALDIPAALGAFVCVFGGALEVGELRRRAGDGDMALVTAGDELKLRAQADGARALVLAGEPLREPTVRYGPFVMNTREEILQAFRDSQSGRFGGIARG